MKKFTNFDHWDTPDHRFKSEEARSIVMKDNQEYLDLFLMSPDYTKTEKEYFQTVLHYLQQNGYAYPGGAKAGRNVIPFPLAEIPGINPEDLPYPILYVVTWPSTPGIFNHLFEAESFGDQNACSAGGDLFRYDYLQPRFHSARLGQD